jgi:hypothetical protein
MENNSISANKKNNFISCFLMGGLGNQLFQIFTTFAYGLKTNSQVIFPYSIELHVGITTRNTYWDNFLINLKKYTTYMDQMYTNNTLLSLPIYKENGFHYNEIKAKPNTLLYGYFQSYKYFESYKKELFSLINLEKQQENMKYLHSQYFHKDKHIISMHFRIGDYKNIQDTHPVMPCEYYRSALLHIQSSRRGSKCRVLFFCEKDDIIDVSNIIKVLIKEFPEIEFINVNDNINDWEQMLIMSCCHDNIIANSTFSWWGGYFNPNDNKIVCYPYRWFGPNLNHDTIDLYPNDWKKIYF